jgi:hypothetical protein
MPPHNPQQRSDGMIHEHPKNFPHREHSRTAEKLPDPWLFDSESLLRELDRCRELVLEIPVSNSNATHMGINIAVYALWNLRDTLRELLRIHSEAQDAFARKAEGLDPVIQDRRPGVIHQVPPRKRQKKIATATNVPKIHSISA